MCRFMTITKFPTRLFGRKDIGAITGVPDDLLGYWLTERLLLPVVHTEDQTRKHRRFDFRQIHLAILLKELHSFGVNINGLRGFSNTVQSAIRIGNEIGSDELNWSVASAIELIDDFYRDIQVRVYSKSFQDMIVATSVEQIILHSAELHDSDTETVANFASDRPRSDSELLRIYRGLVSEESLVSRSGTGRGANWDETTWIAHPNASGTWDISDPDIGRRMAAKNLIRSGIFISISRIFRDMWAGAAGHV